MDKRKSVTAGAVTFVFGALEAQHAVAQDAGPDTALAGLGGGAVSDANGGAIGAGDINAGSNAGAALGVGDTMGDVSASGGAMSNTTGGAFDASGGTSISDGSGGSFNYADPSPFS